MMFIAFRHGISALLLELRRREVEGTALTSRSSQASLGCRDIQPQDVTVPLEKENACEFIEKRHPCPFPLLGTLVTAQTDRVWQE